MDDLPPDSLIVAHIKSVSFRTGRESTRLATVLQRCWPGGPTDRSDACARDWLRRWTPRRVLPEVPACSCAQGRCAICN